MGLNDKPNRPEAIIGRRLITDIIAAGYSITVYDGEESVLRKSRVVEDIYKVMWSTDEDTINVYTGNSYVGRVYLIYGNGESVISNYSISLSEIMSPIMRWIYETF